MSTIKQEVPSASSRSFVRTAVRDGEIVLVKRCRGRCGLEKVVSGDKKVSEFYVRYKPRADGSLAPGWGPVCKECLKVLKREAYAQTDPEVLRAGRRAAWVAQRANAERMALKRMAARDRRARFLTALSPEDREAWLERHRKSDKSWAARKREEDPTYFSRERREERRVAREARVVSVIEGTRPRAEAAPFVAWLRVYGHRRGFGPVIDGDGQETWESGGLAAELGLVDRRVRSLLAGEQAQVSVDVVSRALTNARVVVEVEGRVVVTDSDLYPS